MTDHPSLPVLIVGAGAAGLTLAVALARRGCALRIIEKLPAPFHGSRGKGIQPRTQEIMEDLGVLDRVVAAGGPYPPERQYQPDGSFTDTPLSTDPATAAEPFQQPLMVPQFLTEAVLRERLAELGVHPEYGCELVDLRQDDDQVTARVKTAEGEDVIHARYLIGADGGRSFVRQHLDIGFPGRTLGVRAVVADVMLTGLTRDAWHQFNEGSMAAQVGLCPLQGTDLFQLQAPIPLEGDVDLSAPGLETLIRERTGRTDIQIHSVSWASAYSMNARLADRYRSGSVFLIGDAAHTHPPTGGQGLNTSMQDAYNLGWKLAAVIEGAPASLLDTYEEERRPVAAAMLNLSTKLLDAYKRGDKRRGREVRQLDIGYPESALGCEAPAREFGPLAGDRAPDAPLRGASGQPVRLFQRFAGPHWTLLGYHTPRSVIEPRPGLRVHAIGPQGDLTDDGGHFAAAYAPTAGSWVLVRPDGYIGAFVDDDHRDALEAYLTQVGLAAPVTCP